MKVSYLACGILVMFFALCNPEVMRISVNKVYDLMNQWFTVAERLIFFFSITTGHQQQA